jgi:hypothetical protein
MTPNRPEAGKNMNDDTIKRIYLEQTGFDLDESDAALMDFARAFLSASKPAAIGQTDAEALHDAWQATFDHMDAQKSAAPSPAQTERGAFEAWAKKQGYRFNEGDLRNAKSWALAAWMARAAVQQPEPSTGICFFCGEPINGEHESDCPQAARAASTSANVASKPAALDQGYVTVLIKRMQDYCDSLAPPMARGLMAEAVRVLLAAAPAAPSPAQTDEQGTFEAWLKQPHPHNWNDCNHPLTVGERQAAHMGWFARAALQAAPAADAVRSVSDEMMDLADRLGHQWKDVDPRAWAHLLVYAPENAEAQDARRFRRLTEDHEDAETRAQCRSIIDSMGVRSYSATCRDVDLAKGDTDPQPAADAPGMAEPVASDWAPDRIWLQRGVGDDGSHTWCENSIGDDLEEAEYVRVAAARPASGDKA